MDISTASVAMSQGQMLTNCSIAVLSQNLDLMETGGDNLVKMMEQSVSPHLGTNVDITV